MLLLLRRDNHKLRLHSLEFMVLRPGYPSLGVYRPKNTAKNARMPFVRTVKPPFTLPFTCLLPTTIPPDSSAFRARAKRQNVLLCHGTKLSPKLFSNDSDRYGCEITDVSFQLFLGRFEFFNWDKRLPDLRPAFTITKLWSIRTTSAEITSPERISWRDKDSSNKAASSYQHRLRNLEI